MATKIEAMMTRKQIAADVPMELNALHVLAHRGGFIEPDLVVGNTMLYRPRRVKRWKQERERKRRKLK